MTAKIQLLVFFGTKAERFQKCTENSQIISEVLTLRDKETTE